MPGIFRGALNYLPPVAMETDSGGSVSLKSLFEYFEFSRRAITCEFFPRCLDSVDPETGEAIIGFDLGYNRETVTRDKTTELLKQVIEEVSGAFDA